MDEGAHAQRGKERTKLLLMVGIVAVLGATVGLKVAMDAREEAAAEAAAGAPKARVQRALDAADDALMTRDFGRAWVALESARAPLDELVEAAPNDVKVLRARLVLARRLAQVATRRHRSADALPHLEDATRRAAALMTLAPTSVHGRADRLATAKALVTALFEAKRYGAAAEAATEAARAVEAGLRDLPPTVAVRTALGDLWLLAARVEVARREAFGALRAMGLAVDHAKAAVERADDPLGVLSKRYIVVSVAADLAAALGAAPGAQSAARRYELEALEVLKVRMGLKPNDLPIRRALAVRHGRLGDRALKAGEVDEAERHYLAALKIRRGAAKAAEEVGQRDLVRALNQLASFHSKQAADDEALKLYAEAVKVAEGLGQGDTRTRLVALGNYAQVLGRLDKMVASKKAAAAAYALAETRLKTHRGEPQAVVDAALAGLRHARLLRAKPKPNRKKARAVALAAEVQMKGMKGKDPRAKAVLAGLKTLLEELR